MENVTAINAQTIGAAHRKTLQALKRPVTEAAAKFSAIREKLTDLAPKIVKLYNGILADHENFTFVEYCRLFDPSVPMHAADRDGTPGYRNHKMYYTLQYMRRLVQTTGKKRGQQGVRDSATDALARTLATILQVVPEPESVWTAIQSEFGFTERLMTRLRKRVEVTQPLVKLEAPRPVKVGNVIHMEPVAAEPLAQPGRNIALPATPARSARRRAA